MTRIVRRAEVLGDELIRCAEHRGLFLYPTGRMPKAAVMD